MLVASLVGLAVGGCPQPTSSPTPSPTKYYTLSVSTTGQGSAQVSPQAQSYAAGTTVTLEAVPAEGWHFTKWSGSIDRSGNPVQISMSGNMNITAVFEEDDDSGKTFYKLAAYTIGSGSVSFDPSGGRYVDGTTVELTAKPDPGWKFARWQSSDLWSSYDTTPHTDNPLNVTVNKPIDITAVFELLDTDNDGTPDRDDGCPEDPNKTEPGECGCGEEDIDSDGDGILDCIDECDFDPNKTKRGKCGCGTPDTDTDEDGTPDCNDECPDDPEKTEPGRCGCGHAEGDDWDYYLVVRAEPEEGGTIAETAYPYGWDNGWQVQLTAEPASGYRFSHWEYGNGETSSWTNLTRTVKHCQEREEAIAVFRDTTVTLTVKREPKAGGDIVYTPEGPYEYGDQVTIEAVPAEKYTFGKWKEGESEYWQNPLTLTLNDDRTLTAQFNANPPSATVLESRLVEPYVVIFSLRLRDGAQHAIGSGVTREMFSIEENDEPIDWRETNKFVLEGRQLPLKVVLVLDFTGSMNAAGWINRMRELAIEFIRSTDPDNPEQANFTNAHHLGVIEFHERTTSGLNVLADLHRADDDWKDEMEARILDTDDLVHGLTRVWDAVDLAMDELHETTREPGEVWAVVFLSDGWQTTGKTANEVKQRAISSNIVLYPVGFTPESDHEQIMRTMASETDGKYFGLSDIEGLDDAFAQIVQDLKGQWELTYVAQKNDGHVNVDVDFAWEGATVPFGAQFNLSPVADEVVYTGVIDVGEREVDLDSNTTQFMLKAIYMPRTISDFRFEFPGHTNVQLDIWTSAAGGVCTGWGLPSWNGSVCNVSGPELEYGAHGYIGTVTVDGSPNTLNIRSRDEVYGNPPIRWMRFEGEVSP